MNFESNNIKNEYLKKKLEKDSKEEIKLPSYFNEQYISHEYGKHGSIDTHIGDTHIQMSYTSFEDLSREFLQYKEGKYFKISEHIKNFPRKNPLSISDEKLISQLKFLHGFILSKEDKFYDISNFLPKDFDVILSEDEKENISFLDMELKLIYISGDPLSPKGFLSLIHEIGHIQDYYSRKSFEQRKVAIKNREKFNAGDGYLRILYSKERYENISSKVLKEERDAWAFALRDVRYFIDDLGINSEDINTFVHRAGLGNYSTAIQERVKRLYN